MEYARRIAVFRAIYLGDLLLAVPALRALRAGFPNAEITLIGLPWAATFVERFQRYVNRFVEFAGYPGIMEVPVDPARTERFLAEQRAYGYDLVIQMHGSGGTSNPFVLALGGTVTAGYYLGTPPAGMALAAPYPDDQPEVLRNLGLARLVGCVRLDPTLEFPLLDDDCAEAAAHLSAITKAIAVQPCRPLIGLHPGAKAPARRWPPEFFATLADDLAHRYDAQLVLTGSPAERPIVRAVIERMRSPALNLAGATSLGGLAALIAQMDLFISNDTGPAHLADALDTPSVTIFGLADHRRWAPLDRRRHPCVLRAAECSPACGMDCAVDHRCLRGIKPGVVLEVADRLLAAEGRLPAATEPVSA